jgi:hypothetical protein
VNAETQQQIDDMHAAAQRAIDRVARRRIVNGIQPTGGTFVLWIAGRRICSGTLDYCRRRRNAELGEP